MCAIVEYKYARDDVEWLNLRNEVSNVPKMSGIGGHAPGYATVTGCSAKTPTQPNFVLVHISIISKYNHYYLSLLYDAFYLFFILLFINYFINNCFNCNIINYYLFLISTIFNTSIYQPFYYLFTYF